MAKTTRQRIIFGLSATFISFILILGSHHPFIQPFFFLMMALLAAVGLTEFARFCEIKGFVFERYLAIGLSIVYLVFITFFPGQTYATLLPFGFLALSLFLLFLLQLKEGRTPLSTLSVTLFGLLYVALPIATLYQLAYLFPSTGPIWLLYLVIVVKLSDTFAYFIGSKAGKHLLAPQISPKKTVEGAVSGVIGSLIGSLCFHLFSPLPLGFLESIILGLVLGVLAELGDLSESLLKREVALKDSNHLPGLGGVLDILDSLLFATPALFLYLLL